MTRLRSVVGNLILASLVLSVVLKAGGAISQETLDHILVASIAWATLSLGARANLAPWASALAAGAVAGGLVALQAWRPSLQYMPYLAIAPVNLALSYVFARGLLPSRRPVLLVLIEDIGLKPADDPSFRRFVAGQCALWSATALATGLLATAAMVAAPFRDGLTTALGALVAVQVLWFVGSHHYAAARYGRPERWRDTLRAMARVDLWWSLKAR